MTLRAREVLEDCRLALKMLEEEQDLQRWRILWAGAVALTRAVGHVLDKIDGRDTVTKQVAGDFFRRWKHGAEHEIFREFIERERNNLLKEYHSDVHPLEDVPVAMQTPIVPLNGGEPMMISQVFALNENIYRPMLDGPWEGDDCRDVLSEAISWWRRQLDQIDVEVRRLRTPPMGSSS
ncbi:MAG: hypothetical protein ABI167_06885 [Nitrosospira sp.]